MSDDDIEIVEKGIIPDASLSGINDICQLCPDNLHGLSETERNDHYQKHSSGQSTALIRLRRGASRATPVIASQQKTTPMKSRESTDSAIQQDVFWHPTQATAPPANYAPGVLSILKEALKSSHKKGAIKRAALCYERTPHIHRESFDLAWGCGYRNFLITCAALMDQQFQSVYSTHLSSPSPPSVRNLQHWLEDAWKQGYDDVGARDFNYKLINTKKKLGTADLYVAFTSRKIPCMLVDFNLRHSSKGFSALTEWVVNYFTEKPEGNVNEILRAASPVVATRRMPVIMQYDGHSITIVGYEVGKTGKYNLLVFDPSSSVPEDVRQAALNSSPSANSTPSSRALGKGKRREESKSPARKKRPRTNEDPDDSIVSIPDSDDEKMGSAHRAVASKLALDSDRVIKAFRLRGSKKKQDYQLLYFTMDDPLSDQEQNDRKVVLSAIEC